MVGELVSQTAGDVVTFGDNQAVVFRRSEVVARLLGGEAAEITDLLDRQQAFRVEREHDFRPGAVLRGVAVDLGWLHQISSMG